MTSISVKTWNGMAGFTSAIAPAGELWGLKMATIIPLCTGQWRNESLIVQPFLFWLNEHVFIDLYALAHNSPVDNSSVRRSFFRLRTL